MTGLAQVPPLHRDRSFRLYAASLLMATAGSTVAIVVLPLLVYQRTGSAAATAALAAAAVLPYLLLGLIAGPIADRWNRKRIMIVCDLFKVTALVSIPIAEGLGTLTLSHIYVVAILNAVLFVFSDAAAFGALPAVVGPHRLAAATGFLSSASSVVAISGPSVGAALAATLGTATVLYIDAAAILASAALLAAVRTPMRVTEPDRGVSVREAAVVGLQFVRDHPVIRPLITVGFLNSVAFGAVGATWVVYAVEQLGLADDDARIGWVYSASAIGGLLAGLAFPLIFAVHRVRRLTVVSTLACAAASAALAASTSLSLSIGLFIAYAVALQTTITTGITYRQIATPDPLRSRVNVVGRMVAMGGQPVGAVAGGLLASSASVGATYLGAGLVFLLATGVAHRCVPVGQEPGPSQTRKCGCSWRLGARPGGSGARRMRQGIAGIRRAE